MLLNLNIHFATEKEFVARTTRLGKTNALMSMLKAFVARTSSFLYAGNAKLVRVTIIVEARLG